MRKLTLIAATALAVSLAGAAFARGPVSPTQSGQVRATSGGEGAVRATSGGEGAVRATSGGEGAVRATSGGSATPIRR